MLMQGVRGVYRWCRDGLKQDLPPISTAVVCNSLCLIGLCVALGVIFESAEHHGFRSHLSFRKEVQGSAKIEATLLPVPPKETQQGAHEEGEGSSKKLAE